MRRRQEERQRAKSKSPTTSPSLSPAKGFNALLSDVELQRRVDDLVHDASLPDSQARLDALQGLRRIAGNPDQSVTTALWDLGSCRGTLVLCAANQQDDDIRAEALGVLKCLAHNRTNKSLMWAHPDTRMVVVQGMQRAEKEAIRTEAMKADPPLSPPPQQASFVA